MQRPAALRRRRSLLLPRPGAPFYHARSQVSRPQQAGERPPGARIASPCDEIMCGNADEAPTIDMGRYGFDIDGPSTYHGAEVTREGAVVAEERLYSLTEMADSLGLAEPTARRYRDAFE